MYFHVHICSYVYVFLTELEELRRENQELEESCRLLEQQMQHQQDQSYSERQRELQARRRRQEELERRIHILEEQKRKLNSTKDEVKQKSGLTYLLICINFLAYSFESQWVHIYWAFIPAKYIIPARICLKQTAYHIL